MKVKPASEAALAAAEEAVEEAAVLEATELAELPQLVSTPAAAAPTAPAAAFFRKLRREMRFAMIRFSFMFSFFFVCTMFSGQAPPGRNFV